MHQKASYQWAVVKGNDEFFYEKLVCSRKREKISSTKQRIIIRMLPRTNSSDGKLIGAHRSSYSLPALDFREKWKQPIFLVPEIHLILEKRSRGTPENILP